MTFLEASKILSNKQLFQKRKITMCMSGNGAPLDLYLRAHGALKNIGLEPSFLDFGTLRQYLEIPKNHEKNEFFLLFPWDLVGCLDWRLGIPAKTSTLGACVEEASANLNRVIERNPLGVFYIPAPIPPCFSNRFDSLVLDSELKGIVSKNRICYLSGNLFDISPYLSIGCPFSLSLLDEVAFAVLELISTRKTHRKKVLVTDLDDTFWSGILADLDIQGIDAYPEASGYRHFLYQCYLKKLKSEGVLIVALSKNDPQLVASALNAGKFLLSGTDFVGVWANYESKSKNMQEISITLNIGLSDFVFIDDNPVELAEVGAQFNEVECLKFPDEESGMISFFKILQEHFSADLITEEDVRRTEFYRNKSVKPIKRDLDEFLRELSMELTVNERTLCCRERVLQLINKTNQFNLNGKRWQESEIQREIDNGARLFGASLSDRDGQHGEILAILVSSNNLIQAFVMSCRVFQRKIENAFILQMLKIYSGNLLLNARRTERNEPFFNFLLQHAREEDNHFVISHDDFVSRNNKAAELFKIHFNQ